MNRTTTEDQCQDCWQDRNPDQYAPIMTREGECARCGNLALVTRTLAPGARWLNRQAADLTGQVRS